MTEILFCEKMERNDLYNLFINNKKLSMIFGLISMILLEPLNIANDQNN